MYTQYRGFLCIASLSDEKYDELVARFESLKENFLKDESNERPWVCKDSCIHCGSNGSVWIFIGSEHKNYDDSMENWIKILVKNFNCEGRIERHYEEYGVGEPIEVLNVSRSCILRTHEETHQKGYGFSMFWNSR